MFIITIVCIIKVGIYRVSLLISGRMLHARKPDTDPTLEQTRGPTLNKTQRSGSDPRKFALIFFLFQYLIINIFNLS